jgi:hypothetical protein
MEIDSNTIHKDITQIKRDLALIKNILSSEGKLTNWAKNALEKARAEDESKYTDLEEL